RPLPWRPASAPRQEAHVADAPRNPLNGMRRGLMLFARISSSMSPTEKGAVMFLSKLLDECRGYSGRHPSRPRRVGRRLSLESLEVRNLLTTNFGSPIMLPVPAGVGGGAKSIVIADVGNGHQDIVVLGSPIGSSSSVSVLLGNGDGTFKRAI